MTSWQPLTDELDRWNAAGRTATFWWRDDDASTATAALDTLLSLRCAVDVPLALAVIPACADATLGMAVRGGAVDVLQHGFLHRNHAPRGADKAEFGPQRPRNEMLAELKHGQQRLATICSVLPVLVPPWNRMDRDLIAALPAIGINGVSAIWPRTPAPPGVTMVNTHIDVMEWRKRRFTGVDAALAAAVGHLAGRREGTVDPDEPTGLLTHHLAHDRPAWDFIRRFIDTTVAHPAARWLAARALFVRTPDSSGA